MKRRITRITATLAALSFIGITPTYGNISEESGPHEDTTITDIQPAPDGYWSQKRIVSAVENTNIELYDEEDINLETHSQNKLNGFAEEPWEAVAYQDHPHPMPEPVIHKGIEHPRTVGKLIATAHIKGEEPKNFSCTATVVNSESESLLITAGHCVWPRDREQTNYNMKFIPSYHIDHNEEVKQPFGEWDVVSAIGRDCWIKFLNKACDQAFLKVAPKGENNTTLQSIVGGEGFIIGGSPERGQPTPEQPFLQPIVMHGYPVPDNEKFPGLVPDHERVHKCQNSTSPANVFKGAIQITCSEQTKPQPFISGASGSAFIEHGQSGTSVIATIQGRVTETNADSPIFGILNNNITKDMYEDLDKHIPLL